MRLSDRLLDGLLVGLFRLANRVLARLAKLAIRRGLPRAVVEVPLDLRTHGVRRPPHLDCGFRVEIVSHRKSWWDQREGGLHPEWALDNKLDAYRFMASIGVRTPEVLFAGRSCDRVELLPGSVVKPEAGYHSYGVFVIDGQGVAREVATRAEFGTAEAVQARMRALLAEGRVERDLWYAEARVASAGRHTAPDLKFYGFYGEVALVLKIDRDGPTELYETLDRSGRPMPSGIYADRPLPHVAVTEAMFAEAERISSMIPCPFLRLDFLLGDAPVFGEIGNNVGNNQLWCNAWDRRLGDAFARARGRLLTDLRQGKRFAEYDRFLDDIRQRATTG